MAGAGAGQRWRVSHRGWTGRLVEVIPWAESPPDRPPVFLTDAEADEIEALQRRATPPRPQRRPAVGLPATVLLALVATFFAWVTAEPLWLAFGHGQAGTATVTRCAGSGLGQRCVGEFTSTTEFTPVPVALLGLPPETRRAGVLVPARMVAGSRQAFVGVGSGDLHLRWLIGLALVVLCGAGIAWASGANRLNDVGSRRWATATSHAGPLLLTAGFLVAAW
jgi:hypothetical protein